MAWNVSSSLRTTLLLTMSTTLTSSMGRSAELRLGSVTSVSSPLRLRHTSGCYSASVLMSGSISMVLFSALMAVS